MIKINRNNSINLNEIEDKHYNYFKRTGFVELEKIVKLKSKYKLSKEELKFFKFLYSEEVANNKGEMFKGNTKVIEVLIKGKVNKLSELKDIIYPMYNQLCDDLYFRTHIHFNGYSNKKRGELLELINKYKMDILEYDKEHKSYEEIKKKLSFNKSDITVKKLKELIKNLKECLEYNSNFNRTINTVFNYNKFISELYSDDLNDVINGNNDESWGAYHLVKELGVTVCPYCNRNYITTYYSKEGKTRPDLDHFFSKDKYPFLAMSLYNLVPCCKVCNSSLKRNKDFSIETHLSPYENGFEKEYLFSIGLKKKKERYDFSFIYGDSKNFEIELKENENFKIESYHKDEDEFKQIVERAKNNIEVFKLKELYQSHKDYIHQLIIKSVIYDDSKINELYEKYGPTKNNLFNSKEEIINMIVSNYTGLNDLGKRPLSKFITDIAKELGLISEKL